VLNQATQRPRGVDLGVAEAQARIVGLVGADRVESIGQFAALLAFAMTLTGTLRTEIIVGLLLKWASAVAAKMSPKRSMK
jgi:hypothetical protein